MCRRLPRAHAEGGFTLVEVLVSLMIMAIMAGMAWQGVDGIVRARDASQQRLERTMRLNTVMAQWEQDLVSIQGTSGIDVAKDAVPALDFDGGTLRLTRRTPDGLQVVAWSLRNGEWMRWAGPAQTTVAGLTDDWMRSQQLLGNEALQLRAISGLAQWQLYFFRNNAWTNAQSTGDVVERPPGGGPGIAALPTGVRLVLTFADGSGMTGTLTRDVELGPQPK